MIRFRTTFVLILIALFAVNAMGKALSIDEFSSKIEATVNTIDSAILELEKLGQGKSEFDQYETEIKKLRLLWPADIQIEDPPNRIVIDSNWIVAEIDKIENEDNIDRSIIHLTDLRERLSAMAAALDERRQAIASGPTKDSDKQKLDEILKREEFQKPKTEESLIARLIRQFFEWLNSRSPDDKPAPTSNAGSPLLTTVLWVVVISAALALLTFLLYRFAPGLFERFSKERSAKLKDRVVLGEIIGDDVEASEIFAEAEELARRGELRLAVRKGYIAVLCELADRRLIGLARHKTNRDYVREVRNRESLKQDLSGLTTRFERHWYGDQIVMNDEWTEFRDLYRRTVANQN
ncbi:MAG TPA: DUF4129 domain-containing protein [Pyrinomonadaceae bacterium]|nr:DUF4129 domain-containing protein [Pyrinomonadaceae bacterium]